MTGPEHCTSCRRPMCRCLNCTRPLGWVRHEAKGLCKSCYVHTTPRPRRLTGSQCGLPRRITIDHAVVELALAGYKPRMNLHERREAILALTRCHLSARQIADRLGVTSRTVTRNRARSRAAIP